MQDDAFEWDDDKAARNLASHGVSFEAARLAFDDAFAVVREDSRQDYGEDRFILLGMVQERLLTVSYAMRGERVRIRAHSDWTESECALTFSFCACPVRKTGAHFFRDMRYLGAPCGGARTTAVS